VTWQRIRAGLAAAGGDGAAAVARELVRSDGEPEGDRLSNAPAALGALPIGFATAPGDVMRRRHMAEALAGSDAVALAAACAVAAMASYAVAGAPSFSVWAAGIEEAGAVVAAAREPLTRAAVGAWHPPGDGEVLDPVGTVAAAVSMLCDGDASPDEAVAALAGALEAARAGEPGDAADSELDSLAHDLEALRG
jgi:hypothetical protein